MSEPHEGMFLIAVLHYHGDEQPATSGRIKAMNRQDALKRARPWILRKMKECGCEQHGCGCRVSVRDAESSLNSPVLTTYDEEISG